MLFVRRVDLDTLWLAHHAGRELHDARRKRGAEHHDACAAVSWLTGQVVGKAESSMRSAQINDKELRTLSEADLHAALQVNRRPGHWPTRSAFFAVWRCCSAVGVPPTTLAALSRGNGEQGQCVGTNLLATRLARRSTGWGTGRGGLEVAHVG
jgi:hypothetical protein